MATTATLDDFHDRRAGNDDMTCQVVLSAPSHTPGETTRAAVRRDLTELFTALGETGRDVDKVFAKDSPAAFSGDGPVVYCYGDSTASVLDDLESVAQEATVTTVFVTGLSSIGTDHAEIVASLDRIVDLVPDGIDLVIVGHGRVTIGSDDLGAMRAAWAASADAAIARQREAVKQDVRRWAQVDKKDGRAGLGFTWVEVDGGTEWVPGGDYDKVCSILEMVRDGEMSQSQAAAELSTSPRTIRRCIEDRPARYGL